MTTASPAVNLRTMAMDGYRYWVERHRLLIGLAEAKEQLAARPDRERTAAELELDYAFREKLDALYGEARGEFEPGKASN